MPQLVPPEPLVLIALVPLPQNSSQILDNDPYCDPGLYILCTTLLRMLPVGAPCPASKSASPSIGFVAVHGFVGLPTLDLVSVSHATSFPFQMLLPGLKSSVVTASSSGKVSKMPQTMHGAMHMSVSY